MPQQGPEMTSWEHASTLCRLALLEDRVPLIRNCCRSARSSREKRRTGPGSHWRRKYTLEPPGSGTTSEDRRESRKEFQPWRPGSGDLETGRGPAGRTIQKLVTQLTAVVQVRNESGTPAWRIWQVSAPCVTPIPIVFTVGREGIINAESQRAVDPTEASEWPISIGDGRRLNARRKQEIRRSRDSLIWRRKGLRAWRNPRCRNAIPAVMFVLVSGRSLTLAATLGPQCGGFRRNPTVWS